MTNITLCDDRDIAAISATMQVSDPDAIAMLGEAIANYPKDHRLWFLRASIYASLHQHIEARVDLLQAVALEPEFLLARFMLGFLEMLNDRINDARRVWGPLAFLEQEHPLRMFASGLLLLEEDRFDAALLELKLGVAHNQQYLTINPYIEAVIKKTQNQQKNIVLPTVSDTQDHQILLSNYLTSSTKH